MTKQGWNDNKGRNSRVLARPNPLSSVQGWLWCMKGRKGKDEKQSAGEGMHQEDGPSFSVSQ